MIPRCQWGGKISKGIPARLSPPLHFLYIHHTEVPSKPCLTFQQCSRDMRAMQRFHQEERGWQDIGYRSVWSFLMAYATVLYMNDAPPKATPSPSISYAVLEFQLYCRTFTMVVTLYNNSSLLSFKFQVY